MKKRLFISVLLVITLLLVSAMPAVASTPTTKKLFGMGDYIGDGTNGSTIEKVGFTVSAKYACKVPGPASGKVWLYLTKTETNICGTLQGTYNPIVGEDVYLYGMCTVNGQGPYYFEIMFWDNNPGPPRVDFWMPSPSYYIKGNLTSGFVLIN